MKVSIVKMSGPDTGLTAAVFAYPHEAEKYAAGWVLNVAGSNLDDTPQPWYDAGDYRRVIDWGCRNLDDLGMGIEHDVPISRTVGEQMDHELHRMYGD